METVQLLLILIGLSFLGFTIGLIGKHTATLKRSDRLTAFYKYLTAVSVILMLVLAFIYSII